MQDKGHPPLPLDKSKKA
jgi:hypothetical protein